MKKILLPTDLTVQSLWPAKKIIQQQSGQPVQLHFLHMLEIPTGIGDLLTLGRSRKAVAMSQAFTDGLQILRNKASEKQIPIHVDIIYGSNAKVLRNYIEGIDIQETVLMEGYPYLFDQGDGVDFIPFFKKMQVPVSYIAFNMAAYSEFQVLSILLNNEPPPTPIVNGYKPTNQTATQLALA